MGGPGAGEEAPRRPVPGQQHHHRLKLPGRARRQRHVQQHRALQRMPAVSHSQGTSCCELLLVFKFWASTVRLPKVCATSIQKLEIRLTASCCTGSEASRPVNVLSSTTKMTRHLAGVGRRAGRGRLPCSPVHVGLLPGASPACMATSGMGLTPQFCTTVCNMFDRRKVYFGHALNRHKLLDAQVCHELIIWCRTQLVAATVDVAFSDAGRLHLLQTSSRLLLQNRCTGQQIPGPLLQAQNST